MLFRSHKRNITFTTRPIRPGEINGVDYYFITEEEFEKLIKEGFFAEYAEYNASFGHCYYGSSVESYKNDGFIILNPIGLKQIKEKNMKNLSVYIDVPKEIIRKRLRKRGDNVEEIRNRLKNDDRDFEGVKEMVDAIMIEDGSRSPKESANALENIVNVMKG